MDNGQRIEYIVVALPYPEQIKEIDLSENDAIRFNWRGTVFRFSGTDFIEEVGNGVLIGSDICIVISALIKKTRLIKSM